MCNPWMTVLSVCLSSSLLAAEDPELKEWLWGNAGRRAGVELMESTLIWNANRDRNLSGVTLIVAYLTGVVPRRFPLPPLPHLQQACLSNHPVQVRQSVRQVHHRHPRRPPRHLPRNVRCLNIIVGVVKGLTPWTLVIALHPQEIKNLKMWWTDRQTDATDGRMDKAAKAGCRVV